MTNEKFNEDWRAGIIDMLRNRPGYVTMKEISDDIGVSIDWLKKLAIGNIADPGIVKMQKLYKHLAKRNPNI